MKITEIQLCEPIGDYLHQLCYETDGLMVLYTHALEAGVAQDKLDQIKKEYMERYIEYQEAKQAMWSQYMDQYPNAKWELDFGSYVLRIQEDER